ncbi:uncharacterized protein LOC130589610 [Beta vulgaris subsp. vulgaris]|uniref:uncharacterized protein LOC130589610 n=1 Tax=Beta vulgaris subsp. vulgaris TaxID=3555 RepID=UPI002546ECD0|nr:uncharacterized protein LOC130589610 [Beta vulgaris subsp. vulgaris]
MGLSELNFQGQSFTWCNNRLGNDRIYERLDRAYATENWMHKYSEATVLNLPILVSGHSPIIMLTSPLTYRRKSPIKMEAWCLGFEEITNIIASQWQQQVQGSPMFKVAQKCRQIRFRLFKWCKDFKASNNIAWEDCLNKCGEAQSQFPNITDGEQDVNVLGRAEKIWKFSSNIGSRGQRANGKRGRIQTLSGSIGKRSDVDVEMKF